MRRNAALLGLHCPHVLPDDAKTLSARLKCIVACREVHFRTGGQDWWTGGRVTYAELQGKLTFAEAMRLSAMLPLASTTKMTSAPALRASRLLRMSVFSTYTRRVVPVPAAAAASARARRDFW